MHPRRIIFVHGSGHRLFDLVIDCSRKTSASGGEHKAIGNLHGLLTVWNGFLRLLPCEIDFVDRDEACRLLQREDGRSPLVLIEHHGLVEVLVPSDDLYGTDSVSGLISLLEIRLEEWRARRLSPPPVTADEQDPSPDADVGGAQEPVAVVAHVDAPDRN